jgi:plasmid stabilization system protein ParE
MSLKIQVTPLAEAEITEAFDWYETKASGLGVQFRKELRYYLDRVSQSPHHFRDIGQNLRCASLRGFPYGILFRIEGDTAFVVGCFHTSRNPARRADR